MTQGIFVTQTPPFDAVFSTDRPTDQDNGPDPDLYHYTVVYIL